MSNKWKLFEKAEKEMKDQKTLVKHADQDRWFEKDALEKSETAKMGEELEKKFQDSEIGDYIKDVSQDTSSDQPSAEKPGMQVEEPDKEAKKADEYERKETEGKKEKDPKGMIIEDKGDTSKEKGKTLSSASSQVFKADKLHDREQAVAHSSPVGEDQYSAKWRKPKSGEKPHKFNQKDTKNIKQFAGKQSVPKAGKAHMPTSGSSPLSVEGGHYAKDPVHGDARRFHKNTDMIKFDANGQWSIGKAESDPKPVDEVISGGTANGDLPSNEDPADQVKPSDVKNIGKAEKKTISKPINASADALRHMRPKPGIVPKSPKEISDRSRMPLNPKIIKKDESRQRLDTEADSIPKQANSNDDFAHIKDPEIRAAAVKDTKDSEVDPHDRN